MSGVPSAAQRKNDAVHLLEQFRSQENDAPNTLAEFGKLVSLLANAYLDLKKHDTGSGSAAVPARRPPSVAVPPGGGGEDI